MPNLADARQFVGAETLAEKSRPGRLAEIVAFTAAALTLALVAVFVITSSQNPPSSAADSDVSAMYGP
jgi:hypothetical protein